MTYRKFVTQLAYSFASVGTIMQDYAYFKCMSHFTSHTMVNHLDFKVFFGLLQKGLLFKDKDPSTSLTLPEGVCVPFFFLDSLPVCHSEPSQTCFQISHVHHYQSVSKNHSIMKEKH